MTLKQFSEYCNLDLNDLLEVLNWMKLLNKDNTDWIDTLYKDNIVDDLNNIVNPKQLKSQLIEYKNTLYDLMYSRASKNEFDLPKLYYKNRIKANQSILNFVKSNIGDNEK